MKLACCDICKTNMVNDYDCLVDLYDEYATEDVKHVCSKCHGELAKASLEAKAILLKPHPGIMRRIIGAMVTRLRGEKLPEDE